MAVGYIGTSTAGNMAQWANVEHKIKRGSGAVQYTRHKVQKLSKLENCKMPRRVFAILYLLRHFETHFATEFDAFSQVEFGS